MDSPLVSIVLPVYNGERYIREAINSILPQTYGNIELIIVDDCSTDRTPEILLESGTSDPRVRIITNSENQKLPASLNIGFAHASGQYLTWTSHDNLYMPTAIEEMVSELDQSAEDTALVYADMTLIDEEGNIQDNSHREPPEKLPFLNPVGACFLYKREKAEVIGEYDTSLFLGEDYDYWIRLSQTGRIKYIAKALYNYRRHEKSLTSSYHDKINSVTARVINKHFSYLYQMLSSKSEQLDFLDNLLMLSADEDKGIIKKKAYSAMPQYRFRIWKKNIRKCLSRKQKEN